jgi:ADP-ribosylglycohydrolase
MNETINKIKAVILGHAVADALGVPAEFSSRSKLTKSPVTDMKGYGTYPVPAGSWSDDTSMSLAALDVIAGGKLDWDAVMSGFGEWYYNDKYTPTGILFDVGTTCSIAIDNYFKRHKSIGECGLSDARSNGNGSLMRIHPFSLMAYFDSGMRSDFDSMIETASALTHAHERSILACKIYTLILFALLDNPAKDSVYLALSAAAKSYKSSPEYATYNRIFSPDFAKTPQEEIRSSGYVVDTLEAAIWCLLTTDSYRECVLQAVNLGDDTDTVAAIAGGLAGALYGYSSIPQKWLDTLIKREYIEEMCLRAASSWCSAEAKQK